VASATVGMVEGNDGYVDRQWWDRVWMVCRILCNLFQLLGEMVHFYVHQVHGLPPFPGYGKSNEDDDSDRDYDGHERFDGLGSKEGVVGLGCHVGGGGGKGG
jgi:hypothetical protein